MLNIKEIRYGYNDVVICPAAVSSVEHRSECDPYDKNGFLPIFTAPMSTVVNMENAHIFEENGIMPIIPRNIDWDIRKKVASKGKWVAVSLNEFIEYFTTTLANKEMPIECGNKYHILIDIANGNMRSMLHSIREAKLQYSNSIVVMAGNIANVETYKQYCEFGVDYARLSVGTGFGCLTTSNTGVGDGIVSLINDVTNYRNTSNPRFVTKIVADGGVRGYADVIKSKALGADYVMVGSVLGSLLESAGRTYYETYYEGKEITVEPSQVYLENGQFHLKENLLDTDLEDPLKLYKDFYGMASRQGQIDMNGAKTKTSEGVNKRLEVTTNIESWAKNMADYFRSAMSYCGITRIDKFNENFVTMRIVSNNVRNSINR